MDFPNKDIMAPLASHLNETFGTKYKIWNVSEYKYSADPFNKQVVECIFQGCPNPPLQEILLICKSIASWLSSQPKNVAIVHCQHSRGRSALIISCLLCFLKVFNHPGECLTFFCKKTKIRDDSILFPS